MTSVGGGTFTTASTLCPFAIPWLDIMNPRYSTDGCAKEHFSNGHLSPFSCSRKNSARRFWRWSEAVTPLTRMSSRYTMTP